MPQIIYKRKTYFLAIRVDIVWDWTEWKTPFEVFAEMTGEDCFLNGSVALMGWIRHFR